jgi:hypothetical protein
MQQSVGKQAEGQIGQSGQIRHCSLTRLRPKEKSDKHRGKMEKRNVLYQSDGPKQMN